MILTEALQLLIVYLVDEDVPFIETAHVTLRRLLSTPQGQAALQQLEPLQQSYIEVFAGPKHAAVSPEQGTRWHLGASPILKDMAIDGPVQCVSKFSMLDLTYFLNS